ncbi:MAG: hypothetical protein IJJ15_09825 [Ruminococcus sp.]|nr:hypothetical protein [Ruminococcus sp.]
MAEMKKLEESTKQELLQELEKLNKAQLRIKRRTTFLLSIIAMLVLITSTLAWFTINSFASVENIQMNITTGVELRVDMDNHGSDITQYKKTITSDMINSYLRSNHNTTMADQLLDPVTTTNGVTFVNKSGVSKSANDTTYLEFKAWFIASKEMWVHLSSDTATSLNNATTSVTTTSTGAQADIVRAIRVSFEDSGSAAIYEPNAGSPVNGQSTFDLPTPMSYTNSTRLFHLNELEPKQITIRLWLEGNDPECDNDVQDANISVDLLFNGTDDLNNTF